MERIFDINNIGEYTKWTQLFKYSELVYISNYGNYTFIEDSFFKKDWCGLKRDDSVEISFNMKTGGVNFFIGSEELSISDIKIIEVIQNQIMNKLIEKHSLKSE